MKGKTLITGATGLIGSYLLKKLISEGVPVKALFRNEVTRKKTLHFLSAHLPNHTELIRNIEWVKGDVTDYYAIEEALADVSTVYHCAGYVSFNKKDHNQLFAINAGGTANIVNACLYKGNIRLCHVSSIATINNADYKGNLSENVFWKTKGNESDYAKSKYSGEREVWRGIEEGLDAFIVNPGVILGAGFWKQSSGQLFHLCYKGQRFYTKGVAAYVDVNDVVNCMYLLMTKGVSAQRYILLEGNYSYKHILHSIHLAFNKKTPDHQAGRLLLTLASWVSQISGWFKKGPSINRNIINALQNTQTFSNEKIKAELEYQFIPIEESIKYICGQYLIEHKSD